MKSYGNTRVHTPKWERILLIFIIAFCLSCLLYFMVGCSPSGNGGGAVSVGLSQDNGSVIPEKTGAEASGTLAWSGYLSGKKKFETAGCTLDPLGNELVYIAPFQGKKLSYGGFPGPQLMIDFHSENNAKVIFTTDNRSDSEDVQFVQFGAADGDGVSLRKEGNNYIISLRHFKIPNINYANQRHIFLDGVLACTRIEG